MAPLWSFAVCAFIALSSTTAEAFCRTTTCDQNVSCLDHPERCCRYNPEGCEVNGTPLFWASSCVSYSIQEDGSPLQGISATDLQGVVGQAFDRWLSASCFGATSLSLSVEDRGFAACSRQEFNKGPKARNANIWTFDDDEMAMSDPSGGLKIDATALALTLVNFNIQTGELYDADVQLNSGLADFTLSDTLVHIDLASVVTHEAGHFLGLDHSYVLGATMAPRHPPGDVRIRDLSFDDVQGICATYPFNRALTQTSCEPRGGYSTQCHDESGGCGCRVDRGRPTGPSGALWAVALGWLLVLRRRTRAGCSQR